MNTTQAKSISIHDYLHRKGIVPARRSGREVAYYAPYRSERTPSLMVSADGRMFHDWGGDASAKGTIVDLAMLLCRTHSISDALRDIDGTMGGTCSVALPCSPSPARAKKKNENYTIGALTSPSLISYAASRGISEGILRSYCGQVDIQGFGSDPRYHYLAWANRSGGFDLRREGEDTFAKRCLGLKDISIIGAPASTVCLVFEGFFDFLAAVMMGWMQMPGWAAIILNSVTLVPKAVPVLLTASEVHLWLDTDAAGRRAAHDILTHVRAAHDYSAYLGAAKDVNDYYLSFFGRKKESKNMK